MLARNSLLARLAEILLKVINDVLDFSKIEAGHLELDPVDFDLNDCIEETLKAFAPQVSAKGIKLTGKVDPGVPAAIKADPVRLRQVLANLLGNALKFTSEGEISLSVAEEAGSPGKTRLRFTVRDSGIGIPHNKQTVIFRAFAQGDSSTTRNYGGTGLGLTISSRIVQAMGGKLWVESAPGEGSRFHFTIEAETASTKPAAQPGKWESIPASEPAYLGPLRILLAEDNVINQRLAQKLLESRGHLVTVANDGREALELLEQAVFDLVLMDVQMPHLDGFAATKAIRAAERKTGGHMPIIAMTAHAMKGDEERCLRAGMDGYVSKPIQPEALFAALEAQGPGVGAV